MFPNRLRIGLTSIVLLWLLMWGWIVVDLQRTYTTELEAAESVSSVLTKVLVGHMQSVTQKVDIYLSGFVDNFQDVIANDTHLNNTAYHENVQATLWRNLPLFPELLGVRVANARGEYIFRGSSAGMSMPTTNVANDDYFQQLRDNPAAGMVISRLHRLETTGEWIIIFGRRIEDAQGNFAGAVLAAVRCQFFADFARNLNTPPGDVILLINHDMELVTRWPAPEYVGIHLPDSPLGRAHARGEQEGSATHIDPLDGVERIYYFRDMQEAINVPFTVAVGQERSRILKGWRQRAVIYLVLGSIITLVSAVLIRTWLLYSRRLETRARQLNQEMTEKNREWRALLDSIPDPAWLVSLDGRWLAVNERFCKTLNIDAEHVLGRHIDELLADLVPDEDIESLKLWRQAFYAMGITTPQVFWLQLENQEKTPYEIRRTPIFDDNGNVCGLAAVGRELTDRYEAKNHQQLLAQIFDHNAGGILMLDENYHIVSANQVFAASIGYRQEDVLGCHLRKFIALDHHHEDFLDAVIRRLRDKTTMNGEVWLLCKDGSTKAFDARVISLVNDQQTDSWLMFTDDLSERKATEAHIENLTHKDALTGLLNRHGFSRELKARLQHSGEHTLLLLDLNQFSRINDAYGHLVGDYLLRRIGERIHHMFREQDLVGRLGDDQFAVLATHVDESNVQNIINKLLATISKPVLAGEQSISCTACIGISLAPQDGQTAELLLQNADTAMHHAHDIGPNTYRFFSAEMNAELVTRLNRETDLRKALEQHEFVLHYQPQINVKDGSIVGCEALIRWHHSTQGLVAPLDFIPLAEETGQILPIGKWVLEEACRQNKAWQDQGLPPIVMAVNLSAVQFLDAQIGDHITHALEISGLEPRWLELEITESVLMRNPEQVVTTLELLNKLGVQLSIDDFGTGYSSLAYLKRFPVDKIKIDQSFIRDVCTSLDDAAIVRMVLGMARELRLQTIAEGVEHAEQLELLEAWHCHEYQGYLYSRPVPGAEFESLLKKEA
ncbi:hypothetical protein AGMMS49960_02810 [Betaproteobacteria bacterium]|nr:hypothetical protein AGMMS49543_02090 [Betaproteobacteria bacterium]GHT98872.1 hypothetical protein AGMMS49960_02810 [Betaproteobacteria bacterium]GHU11980.1 hypothetical protein AGMMS50225_18770 [Betaproteobacteria bacterium]GHU21043.1 hypothetical protein AGMMS50243_17730 [Betaproteobacteria bacterium]GHU22459.1 hypothetical protein FACS189488_03050 [Betaproteobacteria bacterium]